VSDDDDLRGILGQILTVVEGTRSDVSNLKGDVAALQAGQDALLVDVTTLQAGQEEQGQRLGRIETELRQVKEMVGSIRLREVARLDGRIDQLAQDVAFSRRAG